MKLRVTSSIFLLALSTQVFASVPPVAAPTVVTAPGKFYIAAFGGGQSSNSINATQFGTAYYTEAEGGPLSVNAFGQLGGQSGSFFGGQIGYQAAEIMLHPATPLTLTPAMELEGYSMSTSTFNGSLYNNSDRLPEHDFQVSYPMNRTVFLINAVVNFSNPRYPVHPYIGFGVGDALLRINNATATQTNPPEAGVNHYNTDGNDSTSAFAGQIKVGLSYDINAYVSLFADYRWLYIASTSFAFGSTVYPAHPATSSWDVKLDSQRYRMANLGVRVSF